jgi:hypothetical protein
MISGVHAILNRNHHDGVHALFGDLLGCSSVDAGGGCPAGRSPTAVVLSDPLAMWSGGTRVEPTVP